MERDVVDRLRDCLEKRELPRWSDIADAIDKIERLSMALELIKGEPREDAASWMRGVARVALGVVSKRRSPNDFSREP